MTERCAHGMPSPASCSDCMYDGNVAPNIVTIVGHPFKAKYVSECPICDSPIVPGDLIHKRSDDSYIHYRHAPRANRQQEDPQWP